MTRLDAWSLRTLHRPSGLVVAAYASAHVTNHVAALFGVQSDRARERLLAL